MAESIQVRRSEVLELIGAIVLSTQDVERYMKLLLPFLNSKDPSLSVALARHDKLRKRKFGELIRNFVDSTTSDSRNYAQHLDSLVDQRNRIVHHFNETYGQKLRSGEAKDVIAALRAQLTNVDAFRDGLAQMALHLLEAMRDTVFQDTPEHQDIARLCAALRRHVAN